MSLGHLYEKLFAGGGVPVFELVDAGFGDNDALGGVDYEG